MAGSTALRALILDYGNVLTHVQRDHWFEAMAAELGAPGDRLRDAYWRHRHAYDAGLSAHEDTSMSMSRSIIGLATSPSGRPTAPATRRQ